MCRIVDFSVLSVLKQVVYLVKVVRVQLRHTQAPVHILSVRISCVDEQPDALHVGIRICEPRDRLVKGSVDAPSASFLRDEDLTDPVYDASKLKAHFLGELASTKWLLF